ncbi:NUDIX hydrolase [Thalassobaculum salexigens]|uniref:NUDIX hydrolase n=1 Tax=Thalassobaculum salexigens TaxID=455360 RepID=UPI0004200454|nr:NUDIX domain-containing protein [Thalassobaculum salexigens]
MSGSFADSYLGRLRAIIGPRPVLMPGARVIVENPAGEILLIRRGDFQLWSWPAGSAEMGQTIEDTARTELREETGLVAGPLAPIGFASHPEHDRVAYPHGDVLYAYAMIFHATAWEGELKADGHESLDVRFFAQDALPEDRTGTVDRTLSVLHRFRASGGVFQLI